MSGTTTFFSHSNLKGGGPNKNVTAGIYINEGNSIIQNCHFHSFKNGGVIANIKPQNIFIFRDNALVSCYTTSVYVQGP